MVVCGSAMGNIAQADTPPCHEQNTEHNPLMFMVDCMEADLQCVGDFVLQNPDRDIEPVLFDITNLKVDESGIGKKQNTIRGPLEKQLVAAYPPVLLITQRFRN
jgi:hypothetical protein